MRLAGLAPLITWPGVECLTTVLPLLAIFKFFYFHGHFLLLSSKQTVNLMISGQVFDHCGSWLDSNP